MDIGHLVWTKYADSANTSRERAPQLRPSFHPVRGSFHPVRGTTAKFFFFWLFTGTREKTYPVSSRHSVLRKNSYFIHRFVKPVPGEAPRRPPRWRSSVRLALTKKPCDSPVLTSTRSALHIGALARGGVWDPRRGAERSPPIWDPFL